MASSEKRKQSRKPKAKKLKRPKASERAISSADVARLKRIGKMLMHDLRTEVLAELLRAWIEAEAETLACYVCSLEHQGRTEAEIEAAVRSAKLDKYFQGLSPNELSKLLGVLVTTISYHVKELHKTFQVIEEHSNQQVRGAVEHFYRPKPAIRPELEALLRLSVKLD